MSWQALRKNRRQLRSRAELNMGTAFHSLCRLGLSYWEILWSLLGWGIARMELFVLFGFGFCVEANIFSFTESQNG